MSLNSFFDGGLCPERSRKEPVQGKLNKFSTKQQTLSLMPDGLVTKYALVNWLSRYAILLSKFLLKARQIQPQNNDDDQNNNKKYQQNDSYRNSSSNNKRNSDNSRNSNNIQQNQQERQGQQWNNSMKSSFYFAVAGRQKIEKANHKTCKTLKRQNNKKDKTLKKTKQ